jgi:DHA1 family bicyclomycin/chloramphenicol resistance-like MFS transporter
VAAPSNPGPDAGLATAAKAPWGLVLMLGTLTALGPLAIDMYLPALPSIAAGFGTTAAAAQQTVAVFLVGLAFGQLVYGPLSDRYGRRGPILIGVGLYVLGTLGCMLSPSIEALIACRIVQAAGACAGMVLSRAVIRDLYPSSQVLHVLSLLMMVMGLAPILAPLLGGWILVVGDWRAIFAVQAGAGTAVGLAVLLTLRESRSEETALHARSESPLASYLALLRNRLMLAYLAAGAFGGAALFAYVASSPDVLIVQQHVRPEAFGWVFGANAAGLIAATQINARLARRWPSDLILRWALAAASAAALALVVAAATGVGGLWGLLVPIFLVMASMGFSQSNASAEALKIDARRAGATAALSGAGSFGVGSLTAAGAGLLRDGTAMPMAGVIFASLAVALAALTLLAPLWRGSAEGV